MNATATTAATTPDSPDGGVASTPWSGGWRAVVASHWGALGVVVVVAVLLRLPMLGQVPNGFFLDEASRGYDALSLLRTGADQYGVRWPLFAEGLDDYTPTLYTMLVIPSVAALGLNETAVRLPAALVGIATVVTTFLAGRVLVGPSAGLVGAALVAVSPWHILPSRTGAEWVLLPFFMTLGVWLLLRGRTHGPSLALAGAVLGVGLYSYAFARLLVPLLVAGFAVLWWRDLARQWRWTLAGGVLLVALALPLVMFGLTPAGQARLQTVVPLDRYRGLALLPYAAGNFFSYFSPAFLIWGSEPTHHHRMDGFGPLPLMAPLVLVGLVASVRRTVPWRALCSLVDCRGASQRRPASRKPLVGAAARRDTAWHLLAGHGAIRLIPLASAWRRQAGLILAATLVAGIALPGSSGPCALSGLPGLRCRRLALGSREAVSFLEARRSEYDDVLVSDRLPTPHILILFFAPADPALYQREPIHVRQSAVRSQDRSDRTARANRRSRAPAWTAPRGIGAGEARALFGDQSPLLTVRLPGRPPLAARVRSRAPLSTILDARARHTRRRTIEHPGWRVNRACRR
ncbi:MAG: glycosyltransferase family 39 protein [Chloroflexota bacterium]